MIMMMMIKLKMRIKVAIVMNDDIGDDLEEIEK